MERKELLDALVEHKLTISSMESITGGLFASTFTSIPGASNAFKGSAVTYQDEVKESFGVKKETIEKYGAISSQTAKEMAIKASEFFKSEVSVSFTGNAGPDAQEDKPVGMVFVSIRIKDKLYTYQLALKGEREAIRKQCVDFAFQTIYDKIKDANPVKTLDEQAR